METSVIDTKVLPGVGVLPPVPPIDDAMLQQHGNLTVEAFLTLQMQKHTDMIKEHTEELVIKFKAEAEAAKRDITAME